jgi:hypothetical protein
MDTLIMTLAMLLAGGIAICIAGVIGSRLSDHFN